MLQIGIFHGEIPDNNKIRNGEVDLCNVEENSTHSQTIVNYLKEHYQNKSQLSALNIKHLPQVSAHFIKEFTNCIVMIDTSNKHSGKTCFIILPDEITIEQEKKLIETVSLENNRKTIMLLGSTIYNNGSIDYNGTTLTSDLLAEKLSNYCHIKKQKTK